MLICSPHHGVPGLTCPVQFFTCEYINNSRTRTLLLECASHVWFMDKSEAFRSLESSFVAGNIIKNNLRRSTGAAHQHCAEFTHLHISTITARCWVTAHCGENRAGRWKTLSRIKRENRTELLLINLK